MVVLTFNIISNENPNYYLVDTTKIGTLCGFINNLLDCETIFNNHQQLDVAIKPTTPDNNAITINNPHIGPQEFISSIQYCTLGKTSKIPKPLYNSLDKYVTPEEYQYVSDKNFTSAAKLAITADYLHIKPLLNLCAAHISTLIYNKSSNELKKMINSL